MLETILQQRYYITAVLLFSIGFVTLFLHPNLIKKIIGLNLMDTAVFLFLASMGYIEGGGGSQGIPVHKPGARRPGAHRHRGGGEYHRPVSGSDHPALPTVPQRQFGRHPHAGLGRQGGGLNF